MFSHDLTMIGSSSTNHGDSSCLPPTINPKAAEAELIQKATQTAIIAARSILMSGGTEESALKTAKAAAESVLNPAASDSDTVSGRSIVGSAFGGKRRKAKRQAEVVASMALMSATSLHPNGSHTIGECDSLNKMYGRHIITVRQDEPSVLSGSTRPPKPPTPKSNESQNGFMERSYQKETREPIELNPTSDRPDRPPLAPTSPQRMLSNAFSNILPKSGKDDGAERKIDHRHLKITVLSQSTSMESELQSSVESSLDDRSAGTDDESDEETSPFFFEEKKEEKKYGTKSLTKKSASKSVSKIASCSLTDIIMNPFAATLNLLHCGHIATVDAVREVELLTSCGNDDNRNRRQSARRARRGSILDSRDDTFDDETTAFSYDNSKKKGTYRDPDFPNSYSLTSSHSEISESEGDLRVRSSIRETMENIVNKSKSYRKSKLNEPKSSRSKKKSNEDSRWLNSFEPSQKPKRGADGSSRRLSPPPPSTSANSTKNSSKKIKVPRSPSMRRRATSFFKRDRGRR